MYMIINETNFRHIVRLLLREAEEESESSIDAQAIEIDSGSGGALSAIEIDDPKKPSQKIALMVKDNKIELLFKPENSEPISIPASSEEFHNTLAVLVTHVFDNGKRRARRELKRYLRRMYRNFKDDLQPIIIRYRNLV